MIACAADEIICDESSIVGSIGVVGGSFGFVGLMEKLGVERRLYTSGDTRRCSIRSCPRSRRKTWTGSRPSSATFTKHFIALVRERRGPKLTGPESAFVFRGVLGWTDGHSVAGRSIDGSGISGRPCASAMATRFALR